MATEMLIRPHSPLDQLRRQRAESMRELAPDLSPALQARLRVILNRPIDYMDDPAFARPNAEQELFDAAPELPRPNTNWYHPAMQRLSDDRDPRNVINKVLTAKQERVVFLQFNFARFRAATIQDEIGHGPATTEQARSLLHWYDKAMELRERIAQFNLALVLAMAKRVRAADVDFADLVCEGNMVLLHAIDKFNVSRAFKFSTYACDSILKAFGRVGKKHTRYRQMFPTDFDPALERSDHAQRQQRTREEECADEVRRIVEHNDAELTDLEQAVLNYRYPLDEAASAKPLTLEQVGKLVGLTKERVRQIQIQALKKIRKSLEQTYIDSPDAEELPDFAADGS